MKKHEKRVIPLSKMNLFGTPVIRLLANSEGGGGDYLIATQTLTVMGGPIRPDGTKEHCQHEFKRDAFTHALRCVKCDRVEVG